MSPETQRAQGRMPSMTTLISPAVTKDGLEVLPDNLLPYVREFADALCNPSPDEDVQRMRQLLVAQRPEIQREVLRLIVEGGSKIPSGQRRQVPETSARVSVDQEDVIKYKLLELVKEKPFTKNDPRVMVSQRDLVKDGFRFPLGMFHARRAHLKITLKTVLTPEVYKQKDAAGLDIDKAVHYLINAMTDSDGAISIPEEQQRKISETLAIPTKDVAQLVTDYRQALKKIRWPV